MVASPSIPQAETVMGFDTLSNRFNSWSNQLASCNTLISLSSEAIKIFGQITPRNLFGFGLV